MAELLLKEIQHRDHRNWLNQLNFYQDQIKIYQNELLLVLHRHPDSLRQIEHVEEYRRIFLKKLQKIDQLRHRIVLHEKELCTMKSDDKKGLEDHRQVEKAFTAFTDNFERLKYSFRGFVAHND